MRTLFHAIDDFLRGRGAFAPEAPLAGRLRWLVILVVVCGPLYGAVMGTFSGLAPGRFHQLVYSGVKVPLLLLATFLLCLPSFFVINTIAGLREDFGRVLRAVIGTQSCVTVVLAGLAPLTVVWYLSCADYRLALLFNALLFGVASLAAQVVVRRYYGPLIRRSQRHRQLLRAWFLLYAFVGIQMAWVLRPFIGDPTLPVAFFRAEAWGNAYVVVARLVAHAVNRTGIAGRPWAWLIVGVLLLLLIFAGSHIYHVIHGKPRMAERQNRTGGP
jgi:hypothetical protein